MNKDWIDWEAMSWGIAVSVVAMSLAWSCVTTTQSNERIEIERMRIEANYHPEDLQ